MAGSIKKENRVLLIVNSLVKHADPRLTWLYKFIEVAGVETTLRLLSSHYRQIYVIRGSQATCRKVLETLVSLAGSPGNQAVDFFLQLHGEPGELFFYDQRVFAKDFSARLRAQTEGLRFRLLYNTSCYGDSHSQYFLAAGFKAAIGSLKVNANAATEFPVFCRLWGSQGFFRKRVRPLKEVLAKADRPAPRFVADSLARRYFKEADSKKIIRGNSMLTIAHKP